VVVTHLLFGAEHTQMGAGRQAGIPSSGAGMHACNTQCRPNTVRRRALRCCCHSCSTPGQLLAPVELLFPCVQTPCSRPSGPTATQRGPDSMWQSLCCCCRTPSTLAQLLARVEFLSLCCPRHRSLGPVAWLQHPHAQGFPILLLHASWRRLRCQKPHTPHAPCCEALDGLMEVSHTPVTALREEGVVALPHAPRAVLAPLCCEAESHSTAGTAHQQG
jgi:hypothetical protein